MYNESLITSEVCVRCGACCSAFVRKGTIDIVLLSDVTPSTPVEVISCRHLQSRDGLHVCGNYEDRPQVCRDYNCLSKANRDGLEMALTTALGDRIRRAVRDVHGVEIELINTATD